MALDTFNPYLFVSSGEQSNKFLTPTYADGIAEFQAQRAQSLTGLTVRIEGVQEGTGDPSPDNIRPISGRTGMTVTVQSGETQNEYPITWETEAGTVYGGTLDVVSGVLTVDRAMVDMGTLRWTYNSTYLFFTSSSITDKKTGVLNIISDLFKTEPVLWGGTPKDYAICGNGSNQTIYVQGPLTSVEDFMSLVTGHQIVYELATPQTYRLTGEDVRTIAGYNQIYSDAGPVIDIKF